MKIDILFLHLIEAVAHAYLRETNKFARLLFLFVMRLYLADVRPLPVSLLIHGLEYGTGCTKSTMYIASYINENV